MAFEKISIPQCRIGLSIVSHGQGQLIRPLLSELMTLRDIIAEIIITLNIPEDENFYQDCPGLPLKIIRNRIPKGFGDNHNAAFDVSSAPYFAVVNPDIRLKNLNVGGLISLAACPEVGVVAPVVYSSAGQLQDSARCFPTILGLIRRKLGKDSEPNYVIGTQPLVVDWVAGMFMVFKSGVYKEIGGFDSRFFMYFEDVDLCRRLHQAGLQVLLCPQAMVIHDAQRASRRNLKHLFWHFTSACRYLAKL